MDDRKQKTLLYNRDDRGSKMKLSKFSFRHSKLFPFANSQYLSKLKKFSSDLKMNYNIHPGPLENDVLFLHNDHRALFIFTNPEKYNEPLNVKRGDRSLWNFLKENPLGERVKGIIQEAGLGGVLSCGYRYLDHALITASVERWRPETHTFHLPVGEATITLQDINVLWGLPVEGVVVSGPETPLTEQQAINMCETLLGFTPERNDFLGKSLKSATIIRELEKPFSEVEATDEECVIRARSIIFYLIGCTILPDNANNRISLHRLRLLDDLRRCSSYSWGSAALACLYRKTTTPV